MRFFRITRGSFLVTVIILITLVAVIGIAAFAATNTLPPTHLGESITAITANSLKPAACASINLTTIVYCPAQGKCSGTGASNLILGTTGNDNIQGKNGSDCIIPGGGDDIVQGNKGRDVCIEGPGDDSYKDCTVINP